ncbi:hypothetical protein C0J52_24955 [Blattella germanica]|nr:hypothetical protein C0J52_24955 [Blattella germanica]
MPKVFMLEHRVFMYDNYVKTESCREVVKRFGKKFPGVKPPSRDTVRLVVNRFRKTGSVIDKKPKVTYRVLTEEKLDEVREKLELMPTKSLSRLAQETGISKSSAWRGILVARLVIIDRFSMQYVAAVLAATWWRKAGEWGAAPQK